MRALVIKSQFDSKIGNMKTFLILALVCYLNLRLASCDCSVPLNDLPKPQPIYIQNGVYWAPNTETGNLVLQDGESVQVGCPGKTNAVLLGKTAAETSLANNTVEAKCVKGTTFTVGEWKGSFPSIRCKSNPTIDSLETSTECVGGNKIYRVGFTVAGEFRELYQLCFDKEGATTAYSRHSVGPASSYRQSSGRPAFIENGMFETTAVADLYKSKNQKLRFNTVLGEGMGDRYIRTNQYLARGHLTPRADFPLFGQQRATFLYANAAPQWTRSNGGDWASLEDSVRDHVKAYGKEITVYTGTYGVEQLRDKDGELTAVYLDKDGNNNGIVPVPQYYYKVIYDPLHKKAAAFVQINSSFYGRDATDRLTFCEDVCQSDEKMSWVRWRDSDGTTSFCCSFEEFSRTVEHFELDVEGLFY